MTRPTRAAALLLGIVLVVGAACEGFDITTHQATITVTNTSATETAVIAILGDDVHSYPTLGTGKSAIVKTNVGGHYEVRVVMTPQQVQDYRTSLQILKSNTSKVLDGTATTEDMTAWFARLAGVNAALAALNTGGAAGCTGTVDLKASDPSVLANVTWTDQLGSGFWAASCGSS